MLSSITPIARDLVREAAHPLTGLPTDYDELLQFIGEARFVLLGEASHGTHEFYRERIRITQRLIREKGFVAVAVEADWPDTYRVNRYVHGENADADAVEALSSFRRFPAWMWRNADVLDFIGWLRTHNDYLEPARKVGFYGLDLYSLYTSIGAVLSYLDKVDPDAAHRARVRYACFEQFGEDPQSYGYSAGLGLRPDCEAEAVAQLVDLQRAVLEYARKDGGVATERFFDARQNALVVRDAEEYYRSMFRGRVSSWNLRDQHMTETLESLMQHLERTHHRPKVVIWAHNSHLGDARATQMGQAGELNVGQLVRQKYGRDCRLIGFTTYNGTVTAASEWDAPAQRKKVNEARPDSYEGLFHEVGIPSFALTLEPGSHVAGALREPMLERAIGVIYLPQSELASHYFRARLSDQFDAVIHIDSTRAVEPLETIAGPDMGEPAETFPSGI